ncbi:MAG TPA: DNA-binding response regulator [Firmicutes bacterium]|nr:DNA-binding response regulator [Bacillota bacterium]
MEKILVVDDEEALVRLITYNLNKAGFETVAAFDGDQAWHLINTEQPDLIILDLMLPGKDGLEICREIRRANLQTPIIMLTARDDEIDRVLGLEMGADDYVTKPFSPKELVARVNAVLRRSWRRDYQEVTSGDLVICVNQSKHEVTINNQQVDLTPTEYRLLLVFLRNPGIVFSRTKLAEYVFGWNYSGYEESIYVHIKNLRKKLGDHTKKRYIQTVYGVGYRWLE